MKLTISVIKADVGSIGGHIKPSQKLKDSVANFVYEHGIKKGHLIDYYISSTGDDVAILMTHQRGVLNDIVHKLAWDAFLEGTRVAKEQGLYGAGQDLLKDAFSGNVKGMGPAVAEMEIEERPNECFVFFAADKTDPGAYNLPFYLGFADPMYCAGLILSPKIANGFKFVIMDVAHTEGDRVIELSTPQDLYDIAALLRDNQRFVIEQIYSNATGEISASVSTTRLHNIAGKYTGKDDSFKDYTNKTKGLIPDFRNQTPAYSLPESQKQGCGFQAIQDIIRNFIAVNRENQGQASFFSQERRPLWRKRINPPIPLTKVVKVIIELFHQIIIGNKSRKQGEKEKGRGRSWMTSTPPRPSSGHLFDF